MVDAIAGLVEKSMLDDEESDDGTTRYRMLETLRQYAVERLADGADIDAWRRRHAEHYARTAETVGTHLMGPHELGWRQLMVQELDNYRSAVTWALDREDPEDVELAVRIVCGLASEAYANPSVSVGSWAEQTAGTPRRDHARSTCDRPRRGRDELHGVVVLHTLGGVSWPRRR